MTRTMMMVPFLLLAACDLEGPTREVASFEETLATEGGVELVQGLGDAEVIGADISAPTLVVRVLGPTDTGRDEAVLANLTVAMSDSGGDVLAESSLEGSFPEYTLETVLKVPFGMDVVVDDGSGDLRIEGVGTLEVTDGSGDLEIFGVSGEVLVNDGSGDLTIGDVEADMLTILDGSGDMTVTGVSGDVAIEDGSGDIRLRDIDGSATIVDGSGDVSASGVDVQLIE